MRNLDLGTLQLARAIEEVAQDRFKDGLRPGNCDCSACERTRELFAEQDGNVRPKESEPTETSSPEPAHIQAYPLWSLVRIHDPKQSMALIIAFVPETNMYLLALLDRKHTAACTPDKLTVLTSSTAEVITAIAKQYETAA